MLAKQTVDMQELLSVGIQTTLSYTVLIFMSAYCINFRGPVRMSSTNSSFKHSSISI